MPSTPLSADGDTWSFADRTGNAAALGTDAFERRGRLFYWVDRKQRSERRDGTATRGQRHSLERTTNQMTTTGIKGTKSRGLSRRALLKATAANAAVLRALQLRLAAA